MRAHRATAFTVNPLRPQRDCWNEIIPESEDVLKEWLPSAVFWSRTTCAARPRGCACFDRLGNLLHEVHYLLSARSRGSGGWDGNELLFGFQSFTLPPSIYHLQWSVDAGRWSVDEPARLGRGSRQTSRSTGLPSSR